MIPKSEMKNKVSRVWEENSNMKDLDVRFDYLKYKRNSLSIKMAKERKKIEFDLLEKIKTNDEQL